MFGGLPKPMFWAFLPPLLTHVVDVKTLHHLEVQFSPCWHEGAFALVHQLLRALGNDLG